MAAIIIGVPLLQYLQAIYYSLMQAGRGQEVSKSISRQYRLDRVKQQAIRELISEFESSLDLNYDN